MNDGDRFYSDSCLLTSGLLILLDSGDKLTRSCRARLINVKVELEII